jgi:hypothetical protein
VHGLRVRYKPFGQKKLEGSHFRQFLLLLVQSALLKREYIFSILVFQRAIQNPTVMEIIRGVVLIKT